MAFTSGTIASATSAAGHYALLDIIHTFCTTGLGAYNWTDIKYESMVGSSPDAPYNRKEWMFVAPGLSGTEQIFGGIRTRTSGTYANFELAGYFGNFGASPSWTTDFASQPRVKFHFVTCSSDAIDYWLVADGQRACCVFRVGSIWSMFYIGKILPYATATEYPYPFLLAGTNADVTAQTSDVLNHRHFVTPAVDTCSIYLPSNLGWSYVYCRGSGDEFTTGDCYVGCTVSARFGASNYNYGASRANPDGSLNLIPVQILRQGLPGGCLGEVPGVYWVSGLDQAGSPLVAGTIVSIGGVNHIVFPNINRTTWSEWAAVRLA